MLSPAIHRARREALLQRLGRPVLLLGNRTQARNLPMNLQPFRQDSTFLYFTGCALPGAAALLTDAGTTLFLPPPADDDALWHGHVDTLEDLRQRFGVDAARPDSELESAAADLNDLATLAVAAPEANAVGARLTGLPLQFGAREEALHGDRDLIGAVIGMRSPKTDAELAEHRAAAAATAAAFRIAMGATAPGGHEREIAALFTAALAARGCGTGYQPIVTVRGEVLHNHDYVNPLRDGDLLLLDGGGEVASGYGVDITRTWPVSGRFTARQRAAYDATLAAQAASIDLCRPGTRYRDVHDASSRVLARFLADEGLITCGADHAVEIGAHALFFPHGVGHLLGMDVHDLENFGDRPSYPVGRRRSAQFGTGYLRMDLDLAPGLLVTIEPGFYVVPAILHDAALRERFRGVVDFDAAEAWIGFGGIRIEDDVLITDGDPEVLTAAVPSAPEAVEAAVGAGRELLRLLVG